jgi:regulatory protein YycH of two-component signal transduction system YycFG
MDGNLRASVSDSDEITAIVPAYGMMRSSDSAVNVNLVYRNVKMMHDAIYEMCLLS